MDEFSTWKPPQFNISHPPILDEVFTLTKDPHFAQNFARTTKWCPDGSVYLAQCENSSLQLGTSEKLYASGHAPQREFHQPAPIVDFAWYPTASAQDPATFCFVASVRESPVKLFDALDGRLRASYPIIDHRERFIAPQSLAFNISAQQLYCGFEDAIEVFDIATPGAGIRLPTTPSKSSKDGLKGMISALAFCPSYESDIYAAGTLNANHANIALFSESQGKVPIMFLDGGLRAGVMQLQFNPMKPHLLYASFRRDMRIFSWDIRYNVDQPVKIFSPVLSPPTLSTSIPEDESRFKESTNQKHRFDIDVSGRYLSVGRQDGNILLYNLDDAESSTLPGVNTQDVVPPVLVFPAHEDSIGSVAFHPTSARLLSTSGSRDFDCSFSDSDSDSDDELGDSLAGEDGGITASSIGVAVRRNKRQPRVRDSSLKLWKF